MTAPPHRPRAIREAPHPKLATVVIALAAILTAPSLAAAAAAPATSIVSSNVVGPSTTFSEVSTTSDCAGRLVSGGGTRLAQSTPTVQHNGIRLYASTPSPGTDASADGDASPTRWLSSGGAGGGVPDDAQTLGYVLCLDAGPAATQVVVASATGPAGTYDKAQATATCPSSTRLLSGGARTTPGTVGSLKPIGSFPSDAAGHPLTTGANPASWTAVGLNGGGGDQGNMTFAFAICATGAALPNVAIAHAQVPGPALATTAAQVSTSCPAGSALLGGGGFVSDAFGLPGSQGDHLTGSYPSDDQGTPVASGIAASWTVASHSGGVDSGSLTQTDVWALCATAAGTPPPMPGGPGGRGPGGGGGSGAAAPIDTTAPGIAGSARRGRTLTVVPGTWTNAPTAFAYGWLRCTSIGNGCATIAGARARTYRLTLADAGARLRVRETASNASGSTAAVSAPSAIVSAGAVSASQVRVQLSREIVPTGRAARIGSLLARATIALPFRALRSGRATISWYRRGRSRTLLARGSRSFPGARATTIAVALTRAGRRALGPAKLVHVTAVGTFAVPRGPTVRATRTFDATR